VTKHLKLDPHVHSEGSFDGKEPVELILEHANEIDIDAITITDHDNIEKSLEAVEKGEEYEDIIVIPGVEVSTSDGHLLALDVDEEIPEDKSLDETVELIRENNGIAVVPHPFQKSRHGASKRKINKADGIETLNAWFVTGFQNRRARKFAEKQNLPAFGGSDAHSIGLIGRAYSEIQVENENPSKEDLLYAIKSGKTNVEGQRAPIPKVVYHYMKATVRKTLYYSNRYVKTVKQQISSYKKPVEMFGNFSSEK